jgi:hypothetical protein
VFKAKKNWAIADVPVSFPPRQNTNYLNKLTDPILLRHIMESMFRKEVRLCHRWQSRTHHVNNYGAGGRYVPNGISEQGPCQQDCMQKYDASKSV